jgi:predicted enzyme related to lactoylglutathione lyase
MPGHGTFMWNELMTRDAGKAKAFFSQLIGWTSRDMDMGPGGTYTIWQAAGKDAGGMMAIGGPQFEGVPPHWMAYIEVDDVDRCARQTPGLGGKVEVPPTDIPNVGRFSIIEDPTGARVGLLTPKR